MRPQSMPAEPPDDIARPTTDRENGPASPMARATRAPVDLASGPDSKQGDCGRPPEGSPAGSSARLVAECPDRPVDWRWQHAGILLDLGLRCDRSFDRATREARRFRAALVRCRDEAERRRLDARMTGVAGAYEFHAGPPRRRWAVEARLLAGESAAVIADKENSTEMIIERYAALFYDVGDRLACPGYIVHTAIGHTGLSRFAIENLGEFWKSIAYHGGAAMLDLAIAATTAGLSGSLSTDQEANLAAMTQLHQALMPLAPRANPSPPEFDEDGVAPPEDRGSGPPETAVVQPPAAGRPHRADRAVR